MKAFDGFEARYQGATNFEPLPAGAYVGKILAAKVESVGMDEKLVLRLDVTEGDYANYYRTRYEADKTSTYGQKWKGCFRMTIPSDKQDNDKRVMNLQTFNSSIGAVEQSNDGYRWDWNEVGLTGKSIGFIVRRREWEQNGNTGWMTEIGKLVPVADVREGKVKLMKDKPLKNRPVQAAQPSGGYFAEASEDEIPF